MNNHEGMALFTISIEEVSINLINAINSNNKEEIDFYQNMFKLNIQHFKKMSNHDKAIILIMKTITNILSKFPTMNQYACKNYIENLVSSLENINFEKEYLKEVSKYLNIIKRNKEYLDLLIILEILFTTAYMHNIRAENFKIDTTTWKICNAGINYIPATIPNHQMVEIKEAIETNIKKLQKFHTPTEKED